LFEKPEGIFIFEHGRQLYLGSAIWKYKISFKVKASNPAMAGLTAKVEYAPHLTGKKSI
jgi:hypothetical protein